MAGKKIPSIKKNIEAFLSSEEGKISKKSALDLGIGIAALSLFLGRVATSNAITSHISHSSHSSCHSSHSSCCGGHCQGGCHSSCHSSCGCGCGCSSPPVIT